MALNGDKNLSSWKLLVKIKDWKKKKPKAIYGVHVEFHIFWKMSLEYKKDKVIFLKRWVKCKKKKIWTHELNIKIVSNLRDKLKYIYNAKKKIVIFKAITSSIWCLYLFLKQQICNDIFENNNNYFKNL